MSASTLSQERHPMPWDHRAYTWEPGSLISGASHLAISLQPNRTIFSILKYMIRLPSVINMGYDGTGGHQQEWDRDWA